MTKRRGREQLRRSQRPASRSRRVGAGWFAAGLAVLAAVGVGAYLLRGGEEGPAPSAWATLGTADVHSLAFDPADASHLYFGHHNGLLESRDGGRTWQPGALSGADAMNVRAGGGDLIQIAGHEVYLESRDGGQSWGPVPNDLPGLDLHAFVVDP
ncbi:MAG: WD40/YVTN/BNR-like repeat-containing protein, partial [Micromonosporaceae bacterium]